MDTYGWLLDPSRCIECRACEAACKNWNGVETGVKIFYRRVRVEETGQFPNVRTRALSLACHHCDNPYCLKACPVQAIWRREDGIVLIDQEKCVGCRMCEKFCPYGAPQFNVQRKKMEKCTMCADRIDQKLEPACSTLCPTGALKFGKWDELRVKGSDRLSGFANPAQTRPRIRFTQSAWAGRQA